MNSLVTVLYASVWTSLRNLFVDREQSIVALVVFAMSVSVLGSAAWVAYRVRRDNTGM